MAEDKSPGLDSHSLNATWVHTWLWQFVISIKIKNFFKSCLINSIPDFGTTGGIWVIFQFLNFKTHWELTQFFIELFEQSDSEDIFLIFQVCCWLCFFQECYFRCNMKSGKIFLYFILSQFLLVRWNSLLWFLPRTTDTQWRHKSKKSENLGRT